MLTVHDVLAFIKPLKARYELDLQVLSNEKDDEVRGMAGALLVVIEDLDLLIQEIQEVNNVQ